MPNFLGGLLQRLRRRILCSHHPDPWVWNSVDKRNGNYDWSSVDNVIRPWVQVGKKVNLIVWGVSDSRPNNGTPAYVMNDPGYQSVTCQETPRR